MLKRVIFILCLCMLARLGMPPLWSAQDRPLPDSLSKKLEQASQPEIKAATLVEIAYFFKEKNQFSPALSYANQAIEEAQRAGSSKVLADAYNLKGVVFDYSGKMAEAIEYYLKALRIREKSGNKLDIARSLNNLGSAYYYMQSYNKAEQYFSQALKLYEQLEGSKEDAAISSNLGSVYQQMAVSSIMPLPAADQEKLLSKSLFFHKKALERYTADGNASGIATAFNNLSVTFISLGHYDSSLIYNRKSLAIRQKSKDDLQGVALCYSNFAELFLFINRLDSAYLYAQLAVKLDAKLQSREGLRTNLLTLSKIEERRGNYKSALNHYKEYVAISDSLIDQQGQERIANLFAQFEFEKKHYQDSLSKAEERKRRELNDKLAAQELDRTMTIQYSGIVIFLMMMLGMIFLIRRVKMPVIWLEGFIFFSALLIFEFFLLLSDPYIDAISGGMPIYKFSLNLILGLLVFYAHSFFENLMKSRLIPPDQET